MVLFKDGFPGGRRETHPSRGGDRDMGNSAGRLKPKPHLPRELLVLTSDRVVNSPMCAARGSKQGNKGEIPVDIQLTDRGSQARTRNVPQV